MKFVLTITWYPWTATASGPARIPDAFRPMDCEVDSPDFARLPAVGETFFFEDGSSCKVEAVGWKLDGTAYLYLGQRYEKDGEGYDLWRSRGFLDRLPEPPPAAHTAPPAPAVQTAPTVPTAPAPQAPPPPPGQGPTSGT